jgi:hypothetical protein
MFIGRLIRACTFLLFALLWAGGPASATELETSLERIQGQWPCERMLSPVVPAAPLAPVLKPSWAVSLRRLMHLRLSVILAHRQQALAYNAFRAQQKELAQAHQKRLEKKRQVDARWYEIGPRRWNRQTMETACLDLAIVLHNRVGQLIFAATTEEQLDSLRATYESEAQALDALNARVRSARRWATDRMAQIAAGEASDEIRKLLEDAASRISKATSPEEIESALGTVLKATAPSAEGLVQAA